MPTSLPESASRPRIRARTPIRRRHLIDYRNSAHESLPHVVQFSGGRSSGMLLLTLLDSGLLHAGAATS